MKLDKFLLALIVFVVPLLVPLIVSVAMETFGRRIPTRQLVVFSGATYAAMGVCFGLAIKWDALAIVSAILLGSLLQIIASRPKT